MAKRRNWTEREQRLVITAYLQMLRCEQLGAKYSKADFARRYVPQLNQRTKGSYEMKLMNVSAVMVSLGLPIVQGYKPFGHVQKSLVDMVKAALRQSELERLAA